LNEIITLLERADKYVNSAKVLINEKDYESSVSRMYYAMFYSVQALLLTKNLTYSSHKGVISSFGENYIKTGILPKNLSKILNRAFEKRQLSDYEYTFVISLEDAEEILKEGIILINEIKSFLIKNGHLKI